MSSQGSRNQHHRVRWWLNKKKGLVGNADSTISTAQVLRVNANQTKSIAIDDAVSTALSSNPVITTPATTPATPRTEEDKIRYSAAVSKSLSVPLVAEKVAQTKAVAEEENAETAPTSVPAASVAIKVEPIAKDKATHSMENPKTPLPERVPPLQQAIKRLNASIEGLYKIKGILDNEMKNIEIDPDWWEKPVNAPSLDIETMDAQIDEVSTLTDRLLSNQREEAKDKQSRQGVLPVTMSFLKTACYTVSPATKAVLTTVSKVSSLVQPPLDEVNQ